MRTLSPIEHPVPPRRLNFFVEFLIRSFAIDRVRLAPTLDEGDPQGAPDPIQYGQYLTRLANCGDCHTPRTLAGEPEPNREMAGGVEFTLPQGLVQSANITPDRDTGIGRWTEERFVARFKSFADSGLRARAVGPAGMNTTMPWTMYAGMSRTDLEAIYAYLQQVPAVRNRVAPFAPDRLRRDTTASDRR